MPLEVYDMKPEGMIAYLRYNGYHFNKKMCDWAVGQMEEMLETAGLKLDNLVGYDHVYVANMCKADFWGSSIKDEESMARYVKDTVDDVDQKDGFIFNRFYADCCHGGLPIPWDDVL